MPTFEFDPFEKTGLEITEGPLKRKALRAVAEYVKEQALLHIGDGTSPIKGGKWKRSLSPTYKAEKKEVSSADFSNLELYGDMLDSLESKVNDTTITYGVPESSKEAAKADGNNRGTYGLSNRRNRSKAREFIPVGEQTFKDKIWQGVERILKDHGGE